MPTLPDGFDRFTHAGSIPDGPQGDPGESPTVLDGDYRNAPGADHFWKQNELPDDVNIPAVID